MQYILIPFLHKVILFATRMLLCNVIFSIKFLILIQNTLGIDKILLNKWLFAYLFSQCFTAQSLQIMMLLFAHIIRVYYSSEINLVKSIFGKKGIINQLLNGVAFAQFRLSCHSYLIPIILPFLPNIAAYLKSLRKMLIFNKVNQSVHTLVS